MKLSELDPKAVTLVSGAQASEGDAPLRLSDLPSDQITLVSDKRGPQVYEKPVGPEQASAFGRFKERVQDPLRWKAILTGEGPYAAQVVQGDAPLMLPGGAVPRLAQAATRLAEAKGVGAGLARTALSGGQGAVMSALDTREGESLGDKIERTKSGAKLSAGIQAAAESLPVVGKLAGAVGRKLGSAVSGVDESLVQNYAAKTDTVNDLIRESGGDVTQAADIVRREGMAGLQSRKSSVNAAISRALSQAPAEAVHDVRPIIAKLEAAKAKLNPNFKSGPIAEIDEMLEAIKREAPDGKANLSSLYQIKQYLNEGSASAYNKGGQIFTRAGESARAAKDAAGEARSVLKSASPEIAEADQYLSRLHRFERDLNKNLLAEGKPDGALLAAGADRNQRNAQKLQALERLSGVPFYERAKDLATAKAFANPAILPADYTGKAVARQAGAAILGTALGGPLGGAIGGALASPMAVKLGVNAINEARQVAGKLPAGRLVRENPVTTTAVTQLMAGQIRRANEPGPAAPVLGDVPPKGEMRWALNGLERLGIQDRELASKLLQSKEGKRLLIEASDLPPGSRALNRIKDQIQKGWGRRHGDEPTASSTSKVPGRERQPAGRR